MKKGNVRKKRGREGGRKGGGGGGIEINMREKKVDM